MAYNIEPIKQEVDELIYSNQEIVVSSQQEYISAGDLLKLVKMKIKNIDEQRKSWTRPIDEAKSKIMKDVKTIIDPLEKFKKHIESKMVEWWEVEKIRKDAEQKEIDKKALAEIEEKGEGEVDVEVVNDLKTQRGNVATSTVVKRWTYKIIDEDKIPRKYLSADDKKINQAINKGRERKIEGLEIYQKARINSR